MVINLIALNHSLPCLHLSPYCNWRTHFIMMISDKNVLTYQLTDIISGNKIQSLLTNEENAQQAAGSSENLFTELKASLRSQ